MSFFPKAAEMLRQFDPSMPWYRSKIIVACAVALICLLGSRIGIVVSEADQASLTELILAMLPDLVTAIGIISAIVSRWRQRVATRITGGLSPDQRNSQTGAPIASNGANHTALKAARRFVVDEPLSYADYMPDPRLPSLVADLDRIARTLDELTQTGDPGDLRLEHIAAEIARRKARETAFGADLFSDPAWDILLHLGAARLSGERMVIADLCRASDIPITSALRWLDTLGERGLVTREADPTDKRRIVVELSDEGLAGMREWFQPEA